MRTGMLLGLALCLTGIAQGDEAAAKKYLAEMAGTWKVVTMKKAGEEAPAEFSKEVTIVIKDNTMTLKIGKEDEKSATLVVDPTQKPVTLDMTPKDGPNAGKQMLGLVTLDKDILTICLTDDKEGKTRPKELTSTKDNKNLLLVLKKPE
ncbi:TIGR03067 domain-containing protein [Zavarzinella formosa]|uniref:TIGR03067 domain-containing protein n=1 Tax=Zavarzinella formosa TaxID=360055 RepID=UPI000310D1A5|nr:TIGR03067 domain-containing protein [Zavarzinella formosa]